MLFKFDRFLKRPKINNKEAVDGPFLENIGNGCVTTGRGLLATPKNLGSNPVAGIFYRTRGGRMRSCRQTLAAKNNYFK